MRLRPTSAKPWYFGYNQEKVFERLTHPSLWTCAAIVRSSKRVLSGRGQSTWLLRSVTNTVEPSSTPLTHRFNGGISCCGQEKVYSCQKHCGEGRALIREVSIGLSDFSIFLLELVTAIVSASNYKLNKLWRYNLPLCVIPSCAKGSNSWRNRIKNLINADRCYPFTYRNHKIVT